MNRHLMDLAIPMGFGILFINAFNLADTFFVSRLGILPLAAMSFTFPVVNFFVFTTVGLGAGATSVIARAIGEGDHDRVQNLTTSCMLLALLIVIIFISIGLLTLDPLFRALGATGNILEQTKSYMRIWYFGMLFLVVPMVGNAAIRATGDTRFPAAIMGVAALTNIILDPLLIFGLWGFPRLELQGAAIATVVSRAITFIAALAVLIFREKLIRFSGLTPSIILRCWKDILHVGAPAALNNMVVPSSIAIVTRIVAGYGASAVAAFGLVSRIESFAIIPIMAVASSAGPLLGQNWGARHFDRVKQGLKSSYLFAVGWGVFIGLILIFPARQWMELFVSDTEVISNGVMYLTLVPFVYWSQGLIYVTNASFVARGLAINATAITVLWLVVLFIPMAVAGSYFFGLPGVFVGAALSSLVAGSGSLYWNHRQLNKSLHNV